MATASVSPANYYLITNRAYVPATGFGTTVAGGGALTFLMGPATKPNKFAVTSPAAWMAALRTDLVAVADSGDISWATVFVHGYGVTFDDAERVFPTYFTNLAASYNGVLIGFDWPSDDLAGKGLGGGQQRQAFQNAKANARTTGSESFPLLLPVLQAIKSTPGTSQVILSAICHSMGNYAMFEGASAFDPDLFDQILCVAAMLEVNGFNSSSSQTYCADIVDAAGQVTIYFSGNDDVLPLAEQRRYDGYSELGIYGPTYDRTLLAGTIGVDCSIVVTEANAKEYEAGQNQTLTHTAYFFIPEVLEDIGHALLGYTDGFTDRVPLLGTTAGYTLVDNPGG